MIKLEDIKDWHDAINQVVCGDSLELMKMIPDGAISLTLTDPPYGLAGRITDGGGWAKKRGLPKGGYDLDQFVPDKEYFDEMMRISKAQIIWGGNYFIEHLHSSRCWLIWDKVVEFTAITNELAWTSLDKKPAIFKLMQQQDDRSVGKKTHPTQKPLELMRWCLENYAKDATLVADFFGGSGTTARACKDMGKDFIIIDKEPKYCEIMEKRLEQLNLF